MSEFSWESEQQHQSPAHEPRHEPAQPSAAATVSLSAQDFAALEERILRAVELVRRERQLRSEAEARAAAAEARVEHADSALREQMAADDDLRKELSALRAERNEVRERVERLLSQLDSLELES
jgi:chromosome segregation ATPase